MAISRVCSIPNCGKPVLARGLCRLDYNRWRRRAGIGPVCSIPDCGKPRHIGDLCVGHNWRQRMYGNPFAGLRTKRGESLRYLNEIVLPYSGKDCLTWPYTKSVNGYGQVWSGGRLHLVARLACEHVNGSPPTMKHEAAHACGKGHLGCVNPRHLSWKTHAENQADKLLHGTLNRGTKHAGSKITEADVRAIRDMRGKVSQSKLSAMFGVGRRHICDIQLRRVWSWLE